MRLPFVNNNINNSLTTAYLPVIPPLGLSVNEDENALLAYSQPHHQQIWRLKRQSPLSHRSVKKSKKSIKYNICEVWTFWDCQEGSTCTFVILFYCHISSKRKGKGCGVFVKWSEPTWNGSDLAWSFASDLQGKKGEHHEQDRGHFYEWCNLTDQLLGRL